MKKLLTIAALVGVTSLSYGQGYVAFANSSGSRFSTNAPGSSPGSNFVTVAAGTIGGQFYFELFASTTASTISSTSDPTLNGWTAVHIATNITQGGRINGNYEDSTGGAAQIPGFAAGSTANFAVVGWSSSIGTSWAEAQAWWANGAHSGSAQGYFGINTTVASGVPLATFGGPYNSLFGTGPGIINGWGLSAFIPEPSSFALAGLSAAALLIFRRRKA